MNSFNFYWNSIQSCDGIGPSCTTTGTINIFQYAIPRGGGTYTTTALFAYNGKVWATDNFPDFVGWTGNNKWQQINGGYGYPRYFVFAHEWSHLFGIPDQYYCNMPPQYTLMTNTTYPGYVATFSHRRTNMPQSCFYGNEGSGHISNWDVWHSAFPDIYHFRTTSYMYPIPFSFIFEYTEAFY